MKIFGNIDQKRTIMITESQAMRLLFEAATVQDIYQKYYSKYGLRHLKNCSFGVWLD